MAATRTAASGQFVARLLNAKLRRSAQALHWNYTVPGSHHHLIVMDTRAQRLYRSPGDFPGLLAPDAIERQIVAAERKDARGLQGDATGEKLPATLSARYIYGEW